ncbi:MAG: hypothetical protein P4L57_10220 [Rhizomicrobium sp.]|nr:hypothetical protein [Rhizomicrobium sp.]
MDKTQIRARPLSRPEHCSELFIKGEELNADWVKQHHEENRFLVVNLEGLVKKLDLKYTASGELLKQAQRTIHTETKWREQFSFDFSCSKMQLQEDAQREGKRPGKAVTIIVALEHKAKELGLNINIYEHTAILQAHYFADEFDTARLTALTDYYNKLMPTDRVARFGAAAESDSFENVCLTAISQPFSRGLLEQLASGECAPEKLCDDLISFVNFDDRFPKNLRLGKTMSSGNPNAINRKLGTGNAAKALRYYQDVNLGSLY